MHPLLPLLPVIGASGTIIGMIWPIIKAVNAILQRAERLGVRLENHMAHDERSLEAIIERLAQQDKALTILLERTKNL